MGSLHLRVSASETIFPNSAQICGLILWVTAHLLSLCNKIIKLFLLPSVVFFQGNRFIKSHLMFLFCYLLYFNFCIFSALLSCFLLNSPTFFLLLWWLLKELPPNTSFELKNLKTMLFGIKESGVSHVCQLMCYSLCFVLIFRPIVYEQGPLFLRGWSGSPDSSFTGNDNPLTT